jgi:hypothetical protein
MTVKGGKSMIENVKNSCFFHRYQQIYQYAVDWTPVYALEDLTLEGMLNDMYCCFLNMDFCKSYIYMETNGTLIASGMSEEDLQHFNNAINCMEHKVNGSFYC